MRKTRLIKPVSCVFGVILRFNFNTEILVTFKHIGVK